MTQPAAPTEPIAFRLLIDEAMKLVRRHFRAVYPSVAIPVAVASGLLPLVQRSWIGSLAAGNAPADIAGMLQGCAGAVAAMLFTLTLITLGHGAMLYGCVSAVSARPVEPAANWRFILRPSSLWTLFLAGLAVGLGFVLLVLPGLYVSLMLSFVIPVMAAEGLAGTDAIGRSWRLVRYNPQNRFLANTSVKVFALYLIGAVLSYLVTALVQLPFMLAQGVRMARGVTAGGFADPQRLLAGSLWLEIPSAVLGSFVSTAVSVYTSFGLVLLYFDTRRRKEGMDLEAAIAARANGPPLPGPTGSFAG